MSTPPPRRPSPGPRPSAAERPRPGPGPQASAAEVVTAPSGRRRVRRPGVRSISAATILAGVAVFVVSSVIAPLAGADTAAGDATHHPSSPATPQELHSVLQAAGPVVLSDPALESPPASSTSVLTKRNTPTATRKASVDHHVISGLSANGIPSVALNAYRVAAARVDNADPSCGIQWSLLAGIGREESDHGQFGGAVLHSDGLSTPAIIGPALNGKGNQFIPAPPNGLALDGDATYAHALGPMQFIPTTWTIYGTDADGDGQANIFDINDASLATARYLCTAGGDLTTRAGRVRAVFAYNHTNVYVAQVLALAHAYKTGTSITGLPVGNTSGSLPGLGHAGSIPTRKQKAQKTRTRQRTKARTPTTKKPLHLGGGTTTTTPPPAGTTPSPTRKPTRTHSPKPTPTPTRTKTSSPHPSPTKSTPTTSPTASPSSSATCVLGMICLPG